MTKLIVAQRIFTIMEADLILVLDQGRVVIRDPEELLKATMQSIAEIAYCNYQGGIRRWPIRRPKPSSLRESNLIFKAFQLPLVLALMGATISSTITVYRPELEEMTNLIGQGMSGEYGPPRPFQLWASCWLVSTPLGR